LIDILHAVLEQLMV